MLQIDDSKHMLNTLLGASNGLQMISLVGQSSDDELDALEQFAEQRVMTASDELAETLRDRLNLLRSKREEQAHVIYSGFNNAVTTAQIEEYAFGLQEDNLARLERIVDKKIAESRPEAAAVIADRLNRVLKLRRELKPIKDGIFRYLAANSDEEAEKVLRSQPDLLLTPTAGDELLQVSSRDKAVRMRLDSRKKLWRKVYGQHSGTTIADMLDALDTSENATVESDTPAKPIVLARATAPAPSPGPTAPPAPAPTAAAPALPNHQEPLEEADHLMEEVYQLLDRALGNAMVAFSIYRKNKSGRADEALKLMTELHNETKDPK